MDHTSRSFREHRRLCREILQQLLAANPHGVFDEHALPAYVHPNMLARWLFWQRLSACLGVLAKAKGGACLDYGCGLGLMLPLLTPSFSPVYGVDPALGGVRGFMDLWEKSTGESLKEVRLAQSLASAAIPQQSLKVILALDVLEHVEDLEKVLADMASLLAPAGLLVVSGPTENWLYRLGRRIAGFSGHYHLRNIHDVMGEMQHLFEVRIAKRVLYLVTFFHVLEATPSCQGQRPLIHGA